MILYVLFVHKKSASKRKVCIIFIKLKKKKKKKTFLVGFLGGFFWVGILLPTLPGTQVELGQLLLSFLLLQLGAIGLGDDLLPQFLHMNKNMFLKRCRLHR
jgi:hypothetical protein